MCLLMLILVCTNLSISIREPKPKMSDVKIFNKYKFINIHQRTETKHIDLTICYGTNLSISIREPKPPVVTGLETLSTNLSISIREPKPFQSSTE